MTRSRRKFPSAAPKLAACASSSVCSWSRYPSLHSRADSPSTLPAPLQRIIIFDGGGRPGIQIALLRVHDWLLPTFNLKFYFPAAPVQKLKQPSPVARCDRVLPALILPAVSAAVSSIESLTALPFLATIQSSAPFPRASALTEFGSPCRKSRLESMTAIIWPAFRLRNAPGPSHEYRDTLLEIHG